MGRGMKWPGGKTTSSNGGNATSPLPTEPAAPIPPASADDKHFGLENFSNTCYANSVLQALYFCAPFRELLLQTPDPALTTPLQPQLNPPPPPSNPPVPKRRNTYQKPSQGGSDPDPTPTVPSTSVPGSLPIPSDPPTLFSALRSLFLHIATHPSEKGTVAPKAFVDKVKESNENFRSTQQQDAHEFFNFALNTIGDEIRANRREAKAKARGSSSSVKAADLNSIPSSSSGSGQDDTFVNRLFEGILTSETRCLTCESVSTRDETFLDLSVDIEENSSITACLRQFSASEMLSHANKFFCDSCCGLHEAEKRLKLKRAPAILALHLKRFKYQEDSGRYIKLQYRIAFPLELRLFNTTDDAQDSDRLYALFAVVVHIGQGPNQGHYVTLVRPSAGRDALREFNRDPVTSKDGAGAGGGMGGGWILCDDTSCDPIQEKDIQKYFGSAPAGTAYVLFYQAVDMDREELGLPPLPSSSVASNGVGNGARNGKGPLRPPGLEVGSGAGLRSGVSTPTDGTPRLPGATPPPITASGSTTLLPPSRKLSVDIPPAGAISPNTPAVRTPGGSKWGFGLHKEKSTPALHPPSLVASPSVPAVPSVPSPLVTSDPPRDPSPHRTQEPNTVGTGPRPKEKDIKEKEKDRSSTWFGKRKSFRRPSSIVATPSSSTSADHPHNIPPTPTSAKPDGLMGMFRSGSQGGKSRSRPSSQHGHPSSTQLDAPPAVPPIPASATLPPNSAVPPHSAIPETPSVSASTSVADSGYGSALANSQSIKRDMGPPRPPSPSTISSTRPGSRSNSGIFTAHSTTAFAPGSVPEVSPFTDEPMLMNGSMAPPPVRPMRSPYRGSSSNHASATNLAPPASTPSDMGYFVSPTTPSSAEPSRKPNPFAPPVPPRRNSSAAVAPPVPTRRNSSTSGPPPVNMSTRPLSAAIEPGWDGPPAIPPSPQLGRASAVSTTRTTSTDHERADVLTPMNSAAPSLSINGSHSPVPGPLSASASGSGMTLPKRASRKISFTSALGFGKKKDKEKEQVVSFGSVASGRA